MKYKIGDIVKIKSQEWYDKNKDEYGRVHCKCLFVDNMSEYLGKTAKIIEKCDNYYDLNIDGGKWNWTDEMFEDEDISNEDKNSETKKEIDWEQRRWELFKIFLSDVCLLQPRGTTDDALAKEASDRADRFIKLFKNI